MYYKLKYSSLLYLEKKNNFVLYLKGPLGKNFIKVPSSLKFRLNKCDRVIIFFTKESQTSVLPGFLSIFKNICRTLVFGDLVSLNIQGLGLKFLKITRVSCNTKCLSMSLGYSDPVHYYIDTNCSIFFF
jgi:ribosomal protein L6P/L9E